MHKTIKAAKQNNRNTGDEKNSTAKKVITGKQKQNRQTGNRKPANRKDRIIGKLKIEKPKTTMTKISKNAETRK